MGLEVSDVDLLICLGVQGLGSGGHSGASGSGHSVAAPSLLDGFSAGLFLGLGALHPEF